MAYTLLQVPFAVIYMGKQFGNIEALRVFSMIGDKVMSLLLATGVGAGFGYTVDSKRDYDELSNDEIVKPVIFDKIDNAADKVYASTGLLLAATVCMVILSVAASFSLIKK
ncbi:hypothetical protein QJS04_geneDACA017216 [Acorus gramineus]|uniref:Uncharacterized protein n=1 Tax=Acorus gramineus TaxID=55184 RepID=A0AAV8ZY89_ACOGR|nr:hypothetical protein QJS04_geneDACA017216 [Acorus gramineus]